MRASRCAAWLFGAGVSVILLLSSGCSVFRGSRALDMTPFAENTAIMFGEASKVSRPFPFFYLKPYIDVPEARKMAQDAVPLVLGLRSLVLYSNQVVSLNSAAKSDAEKNHLLAEYLADATASVASREQLDELGISSGALDSMFVEIREAETFLDGVDSASPLVNVVVRALLDGLDVLDQETPLLIAAIDAQIESSYREKSAAYEGLTDLQARYLVAAKWLYEGESGHPTAIDSLLAKDASLTRFIPAADEATPDQLDAAEAELESRLARLDSFINQMAVERSVYAATQKELGDFRRNVD